MSDKWSEYNHQENEEMHIARNVKKNLVAERTANGFTVEVSVKWSYASFIRAEEEKCHKDFIQQFLTGVTVIPQSTVSKWLVKKRVDLTTFVIGMSPPVTIQNHRLLF